MRQTNLFLRNIAGICDHGRDGGPVGKSMVSRTRLPGFASWFCPLLDGGPWTHLPNISVLSVLICEEGMIEVHISQQLLVNICKILRTVPGT